MLHGTANHFTSVQFFSQSSDLVSFYDSEIETPKTHQMTFAQVLSISLGRLWVQVQKLKCMPTGHLSIKSKSFAKLQIQTKTRELPWAPSFLEIQSAVQTQ